MHSSHILASLNLYTCEVVIHINLTCGVHKASTDHSLYAVWSDSYFYFYFHILYIGSLLISMFRIAMISLVIFSEHDCDQSGYIGTVLKIGEDSVVGQIDFETEQDDWTLTNMKIVDTADSLENVDNIPGEGHVAVPQLSMSGVERGQLYATFRIPAFTRVAVEFSVFVSGFDPEAESSFLSTNPDLLVSLTAVNTTSQQKLTNLARLNPQNNLWNKYRTEVQTGTAGLRSYRIILEAVRGAGVIALDGVKVEIVPVVGDTQAVTGNGTEVDEEEFYQRFTGIANIQITHSPTSTEVTNKNEETDKNASNATNKIYPEDGVHNIVTTHSQIEGKEVVKTTVNPVSENIAGNVSKFSSSADTSMYGYTGEVVLICLTILFIILFMCMVYKYNRLRSHIGDYQLDQGGTRQDSQDNQGYDVQMSYRVGK